MSIDQPDILPLLSKGRHRNPRRGACFMELAAFLAGEPWSDHPACTHPLLSDLARRVNDSTSDAARPRLATLIPSVIGLTSSEPRWAYELALLTAASALPLVPHDRRPALAVGVLTCERLLTDAGAPVDGLRASSKRALESYPISAQWARDFAARSGTGRLTQSPGTALIAYAVQGVVDSGRPDVDDLLRTLLTDAIDLCRQLAGLSGRPALQPQTWLAVVAPA